MADPQKNGPRRSDVRVLLDALNTEAQVMSSAAAEAHRADDQRAELTQMADEASDLARRVREGSTWLTSR